MEMKVCKRCVMPYTRPRITYEDGICAACEWDEEKKTIINWEKRRDEMVALSNAIRGKQMYDCIVPVSGGKDSTYVAHKIKHDYDLNVLTVTVTPPLETKLIQENQRAFLEYGYDNIKITPNPIISKAINKKGFIEQGRPLLSWTTNLNIVMLNIAIHFNIPLIMFGEEGESEYGGSKRLRYTPFYDVEDVIDLYTYGNDPEQFKHIFPNENLTWWTYPTKEAVQNKLIKIAHWSYFENWSTYRNYEFARDNYNMRTKLERSVGTYTNYGQLDTPLYDLHTYLMYLKFGFGRCLQDVCIDIREGRLTREEGIELINKYDGEYIGNYLPQYMEYFEMDASEFESVLDTHVNKDLFSKVGGIWKPTFIIQ